MSPALLILKIYTTFKHVQMILEIFFWYLYWFQIFENQCSVHLFSCPCILVAPKEQKNNWSFRDALKKQYGGKWVVIGCEKDEFCSYAISDMNYSEYLRGLYGQAYWGIYGFESSSPPRWMKEGLLLILVKSISF